jgi:hypothetical protein
MGGEWWPVRGDTKPFYSESGQEQSVSLGMGCRRDDGFDGVLLSCQQGETGATRTKSGKERCFENQKNAFAFSTGDLE